MQLSHPLQLSLALLGFVTAAEGPPHNVSKVIDPGRLPLRVHVFEDFETEIEKRWWMRGTPETEDLPPSLSLSQPNTRALRAAETKDFDDLMGDPNQVYKAVIFNPVPGPPMGPRTRLFFRYRIDGTDTLRVQIYSLTNEYHRHLVLTGLPQGEWRSAAVDMTEARRPDGSGGPLAEDERIDDIQFYVAADAELIIDDIILYEAAPEGETRPFPRRVIFTGWFDTGEQGKEWPGDFEIVPHEKPLTWDAAKSVVHPEIEMPYLRVNMRGERAIGPEARVRFRYKVTGESPDVVGVWGSNEAFLWVFSPREFRPVVDRWTEQEVTLRGHLKGDRWFAIPDLVFTAPGATELLVDDLLLYEPGDEHEE